jgi:hypothetical protein
MNHERAFGHWGYTPSRIHPGEQAWGGEMHS